MRATLATILAFLPLVAQAGDARRGGIVAEQRCARCHAIDPDRPWNSIGSTPSFMLMAKKLDSYTQRVLSVTDRRPHIAQELDVKPEQLEDILAYIETLAPNADVVTDEPDRQEPQ